MLSCRSDIQLSEAATESDLAKVPPGDGDSVGDAGQMQPGGDIYGTTRTTRFNSRLIGGVISLQTHTHTQWKITCLDSVQTK